MLQHPLRCEGIDWKLGKQTRPKRATHKSNNQTHQKKNKTNNTTTTPKASFQSHSIHVQNKNMAYMLSRPPDTSLNESLLDSVKTHQTGRQPEPNTQNNPKSNQKKRGGKRGREGRRTTKRKRGTRQHKRNKQTTNKTNKTQRNQCKQTNYHARARGAKQTD